MPLAALAEIFPVIAPLFVLAGMGWLWAKRGRPFQVETVSLLATNIGTPCLVLHTLLATQFERSIIFVMLLACVLALAVFMAASALALKLLHMPVRTFVSSLTFPNAGNAGLSLCLFAFGQQGLALGILFFAVSSLGNFTIGQALMAGRGQLGTVLRSPMIYAVLAGIIGNLTDVQLPQWMMRSLQVAGGIAIPLMLLTLGVSLATLKVQDVRNGIILSVLRLGIGVAVGLGLTMLLGLEGPARGVLIIQCAMPAAVINYVFAARYNRDPPAIASLVVLSTLISFASLPALLLLVLN
ncbi:MAG TPA: AEC family transporter [Ferrovibrio sp.]|jgi:predicted permease|uniref:AEC family transporter n=1 Tax=Ferrovibrio sp. TaxID=1917215 RepID=UPI002B4AC18D|nr:AEC family transporter [Ferrovibrio sp.]HLT77140.1 AEC family transporter [Ferrovibrio sp.]